MYRLHTGQSCPTDGESNLISDGSNVGGIYKLRRKEKTEPERKCGGV